MLTLNKNKQLMRAICLVVFFTLAVCMASVAIYLRSWELMFKVEELQDFVTVTNEPDDACAIGTDRSQWIAGRIELFATCEARQREDHTRSDKEIYDLCFASRQYDRDSFCRRGTEVQILVFNVTNPADVTNGRMPSIVEVGRKSGGPLVFYRDCKTFDTQFVGTTVEYSEYCYHTYKYPATEGEDLNQEIIVPNVGLQEALGNSEYNMDYVVAVVWGTEGLLKLNATQATVEDFIRGQLLSFSWPNNFGINFLNAFSPATSRAGFAAKDNAHQLMKDAVSPLSRTCTVNGTSFNKNQCISMANVMATFARQYYESFQTDLVHPYGLRWQEGAGLFVKTTIGNALGYYSGYDDVILNYLFPKKVHWNVVPSESLVDVSGKTASGAADAANGVFTAGPLGPHKVVTAEVTRLGEYERYLGRERVIEFDWSGCRPRAPDGQVVVGQDGPFPPQCNGGEERSVRGSAGDFMQPELWNVNSLLDAEQARRPIFLTKLWRAIDLSLMETLTVQAGVEKLEVQEYNVRPEGLREARFSFNCATEYRAMADAGIVNRGTDCDVPVGMFNLAPVSNQIPYLWSLPHYFLVESGLYSNPRENLDGLLTPTGPRYKSVYYVDKQSGKVVVRAEKDQISVRLYQAEDVSGSGRDPNLQISMFTKHAAVTIPLYWSSTTRNSTEAELQYLAEFQIRFRSLWAAFIACMSTGAVALIFALFFGMLLYREQAERSVREKRKRIATDLDEAMPPAVEEEQEGLVQGDGNGEANGVAKDRSVPAGVGANGVSESGVGLGEVSKGAITNGPSGVKA